MVEASVIPATFPAIHLLTPTEIYNSSYKYQFSAPLVIYSTMFNFDKLYVESNSRQSKVLMMFQLLYYIPFMI